MHGWKNLHKYSYFLETKEEEITGEHSAMEIQAINVAEMIYELAFKGKGMKKMASMLAVK